MFYTCQEASKSGNCWVVESDGGRQLGAESPAEAVAQLHGTCIMSGECCLKLHCDSAGELSDCMPSAAASNQWRHHLLSWASAW